LDEAFAKLEKLAKPSTNNLKTVDTITNDAVDLSTASTSTSKPAAEKAAKPRVASKKAAPEPASEPETSEPEEAPSVDRDTIVSQITAVYRDGDDATKAKIVEWRNSCGVKLLRDLKPEHMPSAQKFLHEIMQ
jgi:hypothetical protein